MTERKYAMAVGTDFLDPNTKQGTATAARIVAKLKKFHVMDVTRAEYAAMSAREKAVKKKAAGFFLAGEFGGKKTKEDCKSRSLVTLDLDDLTPESAKSVIGTLKEMNTHCVVYSTASHTSEKPRLRVVVFLKDDVPPAKYPNIVTYFANLLPEGAVSNESMKPAQIMYFGTHPKDVEPYFEELPGEPFDGLLVPDQTPDLPERPSVSAKAWDVPGIVGRVAQKYMGDLDTAIEELDLPYKRSTASATCGEFEDRYSYTKGTGADGMVWHRGDAHAYSYHGSDPAFQQNATIFDLVRLHRFHPENDDVSLPINERASHRAAEAWFTATFPELGRPAASVDELDDVLDEPRPANPHRFPVIRAEEFTSGPAPKWWIKGILPQGELSMIYGPSGAGKSFLALDMVMAMQRGEPWFGHKTTKSRWLYICAEAARGFAKRIKAYAEHHGISMSEMPMILPDAPNFLLNEDITDLIASIKFAGTFEGIVTDTVASVMPGVNENDSAPNTQFIANCKRLSRELGVTVGIVHHAGKDVSKGARGHSSLRAALDSEIAVSRDGDMRYFRLTKSKDDVDGLEFAFELVPVDTGEVDDDGQPVKSCVVQQITYVQKDPLDMWTGVTKLVGSATVLELGSAPEGVFDEVVEAVKKETGKKKYVVEGHLKKMDERGKKRVFEIFEKDGVKYIRLYKDPERSARLAAELGDDE